MKSKGNNTAKNLHLFRNLISKLDTIHKGGSYHLNLSTNNIYFNNKNEVFLSPINLIVKLDHYDPIQIWYSSPELSYYENKSNEDYEYSIDLSKSDIWSLGCILCELFFIATPLIQCLGVQDKLLKIIEVFKGLNLGNRVSKNGRCSLHSSEGICQNIK